MKRRDVAGGIDSSQRGIHWSRRISILHQMLISIPYISALLQ